ncbi:MAG TPA: KR domain-containing protein [Thermoguttaceae bacterium]|nr:KR domain-containing protein [Thermoguttaceae bacterium]
MSASNMVELAARAGQVAERAGELLDTVAASRFVPGEACRLAVVAQSAEDLRTKLALAAQSIGTPKAMMLPRKDVFVGQVTAPTGKVAFLFSGQGSQYPGMLRQLVDEFPPAAEALRRIDEVLEKIGLPKFEEFAGPTSDALGKDVFLTQLSLLCADVIVYRSLAALGIEPDVVAGHSYGEFPALVAAGAWDFENAVRGTRARCAAIEACRDVTGQMLTVAAPGDVVERACRELGGQAYPANYNSPSQTVVGGTAEDVARLEAKLTAEKIACKVIPVPRPFHTPLMDPVRGPLAEGLRPIVFHAPTVPMVSSVTNRPVGGPEETRANLVAQMTSPVRYVELIEQLADSGVRAMVEVGPRQVLSGLHGKILAGRDVAVIGCDEKTATGVSRLLAVEACLDVLGLIDRENPRRTIDVFEKRPADVATDAARNATTDATDRVPPGVHGGPRSVVAAYSSENPASSAPPDVLVLTGTPREMGRQRGRAGVESIRRIARRYADAAGIIEGNGFAAGGDDPFGRLPSDLREELQGMAEGAGVSAEMLAIYNHWVARHGTRGATQVAVGGDGTTELLHAFDERPAESGPWTDLAADRELRVYRPAEGFAHAVVSSPGVVGASVGINEHGLAVSAGSDAVARTSCNALVRAALRKVADVEGAIAVLRESGGAAGWEFVISHGPTNRTCRVRFEANGEVVRSDEPVAVVMTDPSAIDGLDAKHVDRLRAAARSKFGVVMSPGSGEIFVRLLDNGRAWTCRHRFELNAIGGERREGGEASGNERGDSPAAGISNLKSQISDLKSQRLKAVSLREYLAVMQSAGGQPPFDRDGRECTRFVLRMVETSAPPIEESLRELNGPAMIVGSNSLALALRKQIESLGQKAVVIPISDDAEKTLAMVEKAWDAHRPPHLFLVTPFDEDAGTSLAADAWERRRRRGVMLPYLVCQKWFERISAAKMVERASVVAATAMGGDFGLSGRVESLESGAMAGLVKGLCIEVGYTSNWAFRTKVIDASRDERPEALAAAMLHELRSVSYFAEIGYAAGRRYIVGAMHQTAQPTTSAVPTRGRPWLITGGARGITAAVARELGARFGVRLHLVGTSPRPTIDPAWRDLSPEGRRQLRAELTKRAIAEKKVPNQLWQPVEKAIEIDANLRVMEEAGIEVTYHACDVGDRGAVAAVLNEIRRVHGPLEGIVHGAGIEIASRLTKKDPKTVARTFAAKVDGAAALLDLTHDEPPRFFFGFGSIAGRFGSIGQTDYAAASDMLAKLIGRYRADHPTCHAACFHWQPWADIGMAARDETRGAGMLQSLRLLPAAEGVATFVDEMLAGAPEPEVLVTDWDFYKRFYPDLSEKEIAEGYSPAALEPTGVAWPRSRGHVVTPENMPTASVGMAPGNSSATNNPSRDREGAVVTRDAQRPLPHGRGSDRDSESRVVMRHVMRVVESPLETTSRRAFAFAGPALILGDNADAEALAGQLRGRGVEVIRVPIRETIDATLGELQRLTAERPAPHLFLMTGRDPQARRVDNHQTWNARRDRGVFLPYAVCQKWLATVVGAGLLDRASLVAATSLGGDFGFAAPVVAPEGGAMTGLVKGLFMELNVPTPTRAKLLAIDAPADEPPDALAAAILAELDVEGVDVEVAYAAGRRSVVRMAIEPVETIEQGELPRGGAWIFTGGARGITAEVAKEMARRFGLRLHLVGKSPAPVIDPAWRDFNEEQMRALKRSLVRKAAAEGKPAGTYWERARKDLEIDRNLRQLADAGVQATYHSCDVGNWDQLRGTIERIRQADGPIEGIVHGAGILDEPKSIGQTPLHELVEEIDVKVDALLNMMLATDDQPARWYVGFGSISGRFGSNNAVVYSMSSDMLCKLAGWQRARRGTCSAVGFHWHPWGEVGMMTHPSSQHTIKVMKMRMMPPTEGAEHLIDELRAGLPESETLFTDRQYYETFYSKDLLIPAATKPKTKPQASGALIQRVAEIEPGRRTVVEIQLDPVADPFLREHRLRDRPTLPMVVALEAFAETVLLLSDGRIPVAVRDVKIPDAVRFVTDEPREVRVHAEATDAGTVCRMTSDFRNRRGQLVQKDRPHFSAVVEMGTMAPAIDATLPPVRAEWFDMQYPPREALLYHGPPLRLLRRIAVEGSDAWGRIELPAENELVGRRDPAGWLTPSAAIDACLYACGVYVWASAEQGVTVPESLGEIRFGRPGRPSERCTAHVACRELGEKFATFDFTLFGDDDAVVFRVTGYRCHVLRGGAP